MHKKLTLWAVIGSGALASAVTLVVQRVGATGIPTAAGTLTYTGQLENPDGSTVTAPSRNIGISAWDAAENGSLVTDCTVQSAAVALTNGRFQLALPNTCTKRISSNPDLWLEVQVDGSPLGRTKLGAVPFAVEAEHAKAADSAISANTATSAQEAQIANSLAAGPIGVGLNFLPLVEGKTVTNTSSPCRIATAPAAVVCFCPSGTSVISGGGWAFGGGFLRESRPEGTTGWVTACATSAGDVLCGNYYLVCSRLAP